MDWYYLTASLSCLFVLLIGNVYFLAHNAHSNDTKFGSNIGMRIIVVSDITIEVR